MYWMAVGSSFHCGILVNVGLLKCLLIMITRPILWTCISFSLLAGLDHPLLTSMQHGGFTKARVED
jgi:hypothetical protein